jgi:cytochrome c
VWGAIPMPAHPRMSDADLRSVVEWVLAGAPSK